MRNGSRERSATGYSWWVGLLFDATRQTSPVIKQVMTMLAIEMMYFLVQESRFYNSYLVNH
jgi:hypothetical protein